MLLEITKATLASGNVHPDTVMKDFIHQNELLVDAMLDRFDEIDSE